MIYDEDFAAKAEQVLADKMIAVPDDARTWIHVLSEGEALLPELRNHFHLYMPLSASADAKRPAKISITQYGVEQSCFTLEPIKAAQKLTKDDLKALKSYTSKERTSLEELFGENADLSQVPLAESLCLHLPAGAGFDCNVIVKSLARDTFLQYRQARRIDACKNLRGHKKEDFEFSAEQEEQIKEDFLQHMKEVDAFELYRGEMYPATLQILFCESEGFKSGVDYTFYHAILYKLPEKTREQIQAKKNIKAKIQAAKNLKQKNSDASAKRKTEKTR